MVYKPTMERFSDPNVVFRHELAKIKGTPKRVVLEMLREAPKEFWIAPSSYSGKYHSPDEFGIGGQVLHTKRVFRALMVLLDAAYEEMADEDRNLCMAAALVHDTLAGSTGSGDHVSTFTAYYMGKIVECGWKNFTKWVGPICKIVEQHAGRWTPEPLVDVEYDEDTVRCQWLLHYADMIATKFDSIDILKEHDYGPFKPTGVW